MFWQKHKGEKKFSFDWPDLIKTQGWGYSKSTYIKVDGAGRVVASGNPLWGEPGKVFFLGLPDIYDSKHSVPLTLAYEVDGCLISVQGSMEVTFKGRKFSDYQNLYDLVVRGGFEHVDDFLKDFFQKTAVADPVVQIAFTKYVRNRQHPTELIRALSEALKGLSFRGKLPHDVRQATVHLSLNLTAEMAATYSA